MDEKDDLKRVLDTWEAPAPGAALDYRVLASYRGEMLGIPWWKRFLQARISLPVPVAVAVMLVALFTFAWREGSVRPAAPAMQNAVEIPCREIPGPRPDVRSLIAGSSQGATYVTVGDFSGFRPVKDWNITIETKGGKR